jgi:hypothetical protein
VLEFSQDSREVENLADSESPVSQLAHGGDRDRQPPQDPNSGNFPQILRDRYIMKKLSSDPPVVEGSAETICLSPFLGWICGKIPSNNKLGSSAQLEFLRQFFKIPTEFGSLLRSATYSL